MIAPAAAAAQPTEQADSAREPAQPQEPAPEAPAVEATALETSDATAEAAAQPSETAARFEDWVIASGDNGDLPFVIIDKVKAEVLVFSPEGELRGATPALMGLGRGDDSAPGIGTREISKIPPKDRTTPAGRFVASFGKARGEENVLWVDYESAVSLHAVISASPKEHRVARLRSPTPNDNRITYGCINVPRAFYKEVVLAAFKGTPGVVYVLPETKPLEDVFPAYRSQGRTQTAAAEPSTTAVEASATAAAPEEPAADAETIATAPEGATRRTAPD
jgi:hypothetical protein